MSEDIAGVGKDIDNYQKNIITNTFVEDLALLLEEANENKNAQPRSDSTRHWAVIYTELEKLLAYTKTYLGV
jgi:hypothetical protein